jgi:hypothetical protein
MLRRTDERPPVRQDWLGACELARCPQPKLPRNCHDPLVPSVVPLGTPSDFKDLQAASGRPLSFHTEIIRKYRSRKWVDWGGWEVDCPAMM